MRRSYSSLSGLAAVLLTAVLTATVSGQPPAAPSAERLLEIQVELTLLADPDLCGYYPSVRVDEKAVKVSGYVASEELRRKALRLAGDIAKRPVVDHLRVHPGMRVQYPRVTGEQLLAAAGTALSAAFPDQAEHWQLGLHNSGQLTVEGRAASVEEKLHVSRKLRQVPGCRGVSNRLTVPGVPALSPLSAARKTPPARNPAAAMPLLPPTVTTAAGNRAGPAPASVESTASRIPVAAVRVEPELVQTSGQQVEAIAPAARPEQPIQPAPVATPIPAAPPRATPAAAILVPPLEVAGPLLLPPAPQPKANSSPPAVGLTRPVPQEAASGAPPTAAPQQVHQQPVPPEVQLGPVNGPNLAEAPQDQADDVWGFTRREPAAWPTEAASSFWRPAPAPGAAPPPAAPPAAPATVTDVPVATYDRSALIALPQQPARTGPPVVSPPPQRQPASGPPSSKNFYYAYSPRHSPLPGRPSVYAAQPVQRANRTPPTQSPWSLLLPWLQRPESVRPVPEQHMTWISSPLPHTSHKMSASVPGLVQGRIIDAQAEPVTGLPPPASIAAEGPQLPQVQLHSPRPVYRQPSSTLDLEEYLRQVVVRCLGQADARVAVFLQNGQMFVHFQARDEAEADRLAALIMNLPQLSSYTVELRVQVPRPDEVKQAE